MGSELEQKLLANWNRETLEAYGVELRAAGDPRGELIAIDIALEGATTRQLRDALLEEKKELQTQWLGELEIDTKFGFVEGLQLDAEDQIDAFDTAVPWARRLDMWGEPDQMNTLVEKLVAGSWPWLGALELRGFGLRNKYLVKNELSSRIDATVAPNLKKLEVRGHLIVDDISHPGIEHLVVDGHDALAAMAIARAMPSVTLLDFALHPDYPIDREPPPEVLRRGLVDRGAFPNVRMLDLSRNEPGEDPNEPNVLAGATPLFEVLPRFPILRDLVELRLPSLRTPQHVTQVQAILDAMPALRVLEVPRMYNELWRPLRHPHAKITVAPPVQWLAMDQLREFDAMTFNLEEDWHRVSFEEAYRVCESSYTTLTGEQRAVWNQLWHHVKKLDTDDQKKVAFTKKELLILLDTFDPETYGWEDIRKKTLEHAGTHVFMRRIDGYEKPHVIEPPPQRELVHTDRIRDHELALQEHWDLDRLAVYADDLQELGDKRGELIAMDLDAQGENEDYRRSKLHDEIFGRDHVVNSLYGFSKVDVSAWGEEERMAKVFVGDVARYISEIEISGPTEAVNRDLGLVNEEPRPWLRCVRIDASGSYLEDPSACGPKLRELWPRLDEFWLMTDCRDLFLDFVHDGVKRMKITGGDGFSTLGAPWTGLVELDFAYGAEFDDDGEQILPAAKLPALRMLDLSRNEPSVAGYERHVRHHCAVDADFWQMFASLEREFLERLVEIKLPSLRQPTHVTTLQVALDRMTSLTRLEVVRRYPGAPALDMRHPTATIVIPDPVPWTPADQLPPAAALNIEGQIAPLGPIVAGMEKYYATMPPDGQRSWSDVWRVIADPLRNQFKLAATTLHAAFEALRSADQFSYSEWLDPLVNALHPRAILEETLTFRRARRP